MSSTTPVCPRCREAHLRRTHRQNVLERLLSLAYVYPFRCQLCGHRFRAMQWGQRYARRYGDRREYERYATRFPMTFPMGDEEGDGTVRELSIDGCTVETAVTLRPGSGLSITLHPGPGETVTVVHCLVRTVADGRLGIQFVQLSVEEHDALRRVLWRLITAAPVLPPSTSPV